MGFFSYLCNGCGLNIRFDGMNGERCVLKHIREGVVLGEARGEFNGYGAVFGSSYDNNDPANVNSAENISISHYKLPDSGKTSGVIAYHEACYEKEPEETRQLIVISKSDPVQGYGKARKRFLRR